MISWLFAACTIADARREATAPAAFGSTQADAGFWSVWGDGKAEVDSYQLTIPRYGELRRGTAVWIFVTETFTDPQRVKSDGGHGDEYPILKHNDVRSFQTGIYDYRVMTSVFTRLDGQAALGVPVKVSMGMQEWCGHVYSQMLSRPTQLDFSTHSYFDGEADRAAPLARPPNGVLLDQIPTLARNLVNEWPAAGTSVPILLLDSFERQRFTHVAPAFVPATVSRGTEVQSVEVPAGRFDATTLTVQPSSGPAYTWWVETAAPHRIVRWSSTDGEVCELVATVRVPYWEYNGESDVTWLAQLGLSPTPVPTAPPVP